MATLEGTINNVQKWNPETKQEEAVKCDQKIDDGTRLVWDPIPFKAIGKTTRISNVELSQMIKSEFKKTFHDLIGVLVSMPVSYNQFRVDLYFEHNADECPKNMIKNLESLTNPSASGLPEVYVKNHAMYSKANGEVWTLNNDTRTLLAPFMYGGYNANKPNNEGRWKNFIKVIPVQSNSPYYYNRRADRTIIQVTGLDLNKLVKAIYGNRIVIQTTSKQVEGGRIEDHNFSSEAMYTVRFIDYAKNSQIPGEFYLAIEQFDDDATKEIYAKQNPINTQQIYGGMPLMY